MSWVIKDEILAIIQHSFLHILHEGGSQDDYLVGRLKNWLLYSSPLARTLSRWSQSVFESFKIVWT